MICQLAKLCIACFCFSLKIQNKRSDNKVERNSTIRSLYKKTWNETEQFVHFTKKEAWNETVQFVQFTKKNKKTHTHTRIEKIITQGTLLHAFINLMN